MSDNYDRRDSGGYRRSSQGYRGGRDSRDSRDRYHGISRRDYTRPTESRHAPEGPGSNGGSSIPQGPQGSRGYRSPDRREYRRSYSGSRGSRDGYRYRDRDRDRERDRERDRYYEQPSRYDNRGYAPQRNAERREPREVREPREPREIREPREVREPRRENNYRSRSTRVSSSGRSEPKVNHWVTRLHLSGDMKRSIQGYFDELDAVNDSIQAGARKLLQAEIEDAKYTRLTESASLKVQLAEEKLDAMNLA